MTRTLVPGHERHDGEYRPPISLTTTTLDNVIVIATCCHPCDDQFACQHRPSYVGRQRARAASLHWWGGTRGATFGWAGFIHIGAAVSLPTFFLVGSPHQQLMWDTSAISYDVDVTSPISCDVDVTLPISCNVYVASPISCDVDVTSAMW